jgi:hypothetical protein
LDGKIKAPTFVGRMWLVGLDISAHWQIAPASYFGQNLNGINDSSAMHDQPAILLDCVASV